MMVQKSILVLTLLSIALTANAWAGGRGHRTPLSEQLGLSDEQQTQVRALRVDFGEQSKTLWHTHRANVNAVFTEQQLAQLSAYKTARKKNRRSSRPDLQLSDDQKTTLAQLHTTFKETRQALRTAHQSAFEALLNEDQRAQLEEIKAARRARWAQRHGSDRATETTLQSLPNAIDAATAIEETSWGQIKESLTR